MDDTEGTATKGGKQLVAKMEQRIRDLEKDADLAERRFQEAQKNVVKFDRRVKELQFQVVSKPRI